MSTGIEADGRVRAAIPGRTQRTDRWWAQPAITASVLVAFVVYATYAAFQNANYYWAPYISPLYSPCLATSCAAARSGSHTVAVPH
ncbi:MAG: hypothetical protein ACRDYC_02585, partial [Acidimicrobiales bacterium]